MAYSNYVTTIATTLAAEFSPVPSWRVDLSWNAPEGAVKYWLQVSTNATNWKDIYVGAETNFSWLRLCENTLYHFRIAAHNGYAWSEWTYTCVTTSSEQQNVPPSFEPGRDILVRKITSDTILVTWTSPNKDSKSWIFINGQFAVGPFFGETLLRTVTLRLPPSETYVIEVHDFDDDTVPQPIEQAPLVRPTIGWNSVEEASSYRVYHTIFDGGTMETLLCEVPPMSGLLEIDCPIRLDGKNGKWHSFRVESVDQYDNESENEVVAHFAADLPPKPKLEVSRDVSTGLLTMRVVSG